VVVVVVVEEVPSDMELHLLQLPNNLTPHLNNLTQLLNHSLHTAHPLPQLLNPLTQLLNHSLHTVHPLPQLLNNLTQLLNHSLAMVLHPVNHLSLSNLFPDVTAPQLQPQLLNHLMDMVHPLARALSEEDHPVAPPVVVQSPLDKSAQPAWLPTLLSRDKDPEDLLLAPLEAVVVVTNKSLYSYSA